VTRPLSIVNGRDKDVIPLLLQVHAPEAPRILDATHNRGVMWKGLPYAVTSLDIAAEYEPDCVADCRAMPLADASFDVIAFDPPHLPAAVATAGSSGIQRTQYGLTQHGDYRQGDNVSPLFVPFLHEARRVLSPGGIVIAKLSDFVHNHRYQWSHVDFINAASAVGMTPCDVIIKADPCASNLKSSKWQNVRHFRRAHCYWIVVRNGRCEAGR
jgi:SAM-dependent methyltransferase